MNAKSSQMPCPRCEKPIVVFDVNESSHARCIACGMEIDTSESFTENISTRVMGNDTDLTQIKDQLKDNPRLSFLIESEYECNTQSDADDSLRIESDELLEFMTYSVEKKADVKAAGEIIASKYRFKELREEVKLAVSNFSESRWESTIEALQDIEKIATLELYTYVYKHKVSREMITEKLDYYQQKYEDHDLAEIVDFLAFWLEYPPEADLE